jgi:hypothetical protein
MVRPLIKGMRWILLAGTVLVFLAGSQLYLLTEQTDVYFAWTIEPPLTAAFLGAFYWTACILAFLSARQQHWARARVGVVGVLLFVTLTLVATLLHLDRFHLTASDPRPLLAAWFWLIVYLIDAPALLALVVLQLRAPGGDPPRVAPLPFWFQLMLGAHATLALLVGVALFVAPSTADLLWPWDLPPLTSRAVGAWLVAFSVILGQAGWEDDWERVGPGVLAYLALGVLQLVAVARYPSEIDWSQPRAWIYLFVVLTVLTAGMLGCARLWRLRHSMHASSSASKSGRPT